MKSEDRSFTLVVAMRNQEDEVIQRMTEIVEGLQKLERHFELILVNLASEDNTQASIVSFCNLYPQARLNHVEAPILGLSLKRGLEASIAPLVIWSRLEDLSLTFIEEALTKLEESDIVVSRDNQAPSSVPLPKIATNLGRKMTEKLFDFAPHQLVGPLALRRGRVIRASQDMNARKTNYTLELLKRAQREGLKIDEVEVHLGVMKRGLVEQAKAVLPVVNALYRLHVKKTV